MNYSSGFTSIFLRKVRAVGELNYVQTKAVIADREPPGV